MSSASSGSGADVSRVCETMVDLTVSDVRWNRELGHPVLVLSVAGQAAGAISIVLTPGDARMLSAGPEMGSAERARLILLFEEFARALDARLAEVRLRLGSGMVLTAELDFSAGSRTVTVSASFADAVVLAVRALAPMRMSEHDLRLIRLLREPARSARRGFQDRGELTASVIDFIESLRLDDLPGPRGATD